MKITSEQVEEIGRLADSANNIAAASQLPVSAEIHIQEMRAGLLLMRDELQRLYIELTGANPWEAVGE